jgi:Cu(I)/Ag(I) efflux system membrane fusion protein
MKTKHILIALAALVLVGAAGAALYRTGIERGAKSAAAQEKKPLYWHDPMVPGQKFDKPGKSPFMDMQLVPVYADEAATKAQSAISPRVQQNLGMRTAKVSSGNPGAHLEAVGSVAYNERDVALVQARSKRFRLERLYVRAPLDPCAKGKYWQSCTAPIGSPRRKTISPSGACRRRAPNGWLDGARQRMRWPAWTANIFAWSSERQGASAPSVTAPISGVVAELSAREGMTVACQARRCLDSTAWRRYGSTPRCRKVRAAQVRTGSAVEAKVSALPDKIFKGKVGAILPEVNARRAR